MKHEVPMWVQWVAMILSVVGVVFSSLSVWYTHDIALKTPVPESNLVIDVGRSECCLRNGTEIQAETVFWVRNTGDRPTTISDVYIVFSIGPTRYSCSNTGFCDGFERTNETVNTIVINAHDTVFFLCWFKGPFLDNLNASLYGTETKCEFHIYETNGIVQKDSAIIFLSQFSIS